jgi:hypothetical protein
MATQTRSSLFIFSSDCPHARTRLAVWLAEDLRAKSRTSRFARLALAVFAIRRTV